MANIQQEVNLRLTRYIEARDRAATMFALKDAFGQIWNDLVQEYRRGSKSTKKRLRDELRTAWYQYRSAARAYFDLESEHDNARHELNTLLAIMGQRLGERLPDEFSEK